VTSAEGVDAARTPSFPRGDDAREMLVWCHERCHKKELAPFRTQLTEAAKGVGGGLYCLKKALGVERWLPSTKSRFFLLLADWREVKPCAEFLLRAAGEKAHALVVYTESPKQYNQALMWASWLPAQGYNRHVHVLPPSYSGKKLAVHAAHLLRELACGEDCGPSPASSWAAEGSVDLASLAEPMLFHMVSFVAADLSPTQFQLEGQQLLVGRHPGEQAFVAAEWENWARPVAEAVASIFPTATRAEIQSALKSAEPELYED